MSQTPIPSLQFHRTKHVVGEMHAQLELSMGRLLSSSPDHDIVLHNASTATSVLQH